MMPGVAAVFVMPVVTGHGPIRLRGRGVEHGAASGAEIRLVRFHASSDSRNIGDFVLAETERIRRAGLARLLRDFESAGACRRAKADRCDHQKSTDWTGRVEESIDTHDAPALLLRPESRIYLYHIDNYLTGNSARLFTASTFSTRAATLPQRIAMQTKICETSGIILRIEFAKRQLLPVRFVAT